MSEQARASETAQYNGINNAGIPATSAAAIAPSASATIESQVAANSFNEIAAAPVAAGRAENVTSFNELDNNRDAIRDEQVPLAVQLDDDVEREADRDDVSITDEETPLAVAKSGLGSRAWWYWILIIISVISGKVAKDKRKLKEKEVETDKK